MGEEKRERERERERERGRGREREEKMTIAYAEMLTSRMRLDCVISKVHHY